MIMNQTDHIRGVSYIGNPKSNTAMFIAQKVGYLTDRLYSVEHCMVFADKCICFSEELKKRHMVIQSDHPQREYAEFVTEFYREKVRRDRKRKYTLCDGGYYLGENTTIGKNVYIDVGCVIGHDVVIGSDAEIHANSVIKNAVIGDHFILREGAVIGGEGFTLTKDENNNWYRIPSVGNVIIGNNVEIGMHGCIARGTADATYIDDYVKIDAVVYVGHDAHIGSNTEISSGGIIGGYVKTESDVSIGFNACIRNRLEIGDNSVVGMGATVVKSVDCNTTVIGNPARKYKNNEI